MATVLIQIDDLIVYNEELVPLQALYKGTYDGEAVTVKIIAKNNYNYRETTHVRKTHHSDKVARLVARKRTDTEMFLAFEKFDVTLEEYVKNYPKYPHASRIDVFKQLAEIYQYFHGNGMVLRTSDLSCFNVVFTGTPANTKITVKVFGLECSKRNLTATVISKEKCVTKNKTARPNNVQFEAPETRDKTLWSAKTDVYALGNFAFWILGRRTKAPPVDRITHKSFDHILHVRSRCEAEDLVKSMLETKEEDRPTVDEILKHPLFWSEEYAYSFFMHVRSTMDMQTKMDKRYRKTAKNCDKVIEEHRIEPLLDNQFEEALKRVEQPQHTNWWTKLSTAEKDEMTPPPSHPGYDGTSLTSLILATRDSFQHRRPDSVFKCHALYGFSTLMRKRYPRFTLTTWKLLKKVSIHHASLSGFY